MRSEECKVQVTFAQDSLYTWPACTVSSAKEVLRTCSAGVGCVQRVQALDTLAKSQVTTIKYIQLPCWALWIVQGM